jgi:PST family polysaccharide transporter
MFVLPANQFLSAYPVAVATLSRLTRDRQQYRRYLLGGISVLAFASMGIGADLTLIGKDVVRFLLGMKWEESGRLFTYFGPGIGAMLVYRTQGMIHLSLGTTSRYFRWAVIELVATAACFLWGLRWGAAGIALAWTVSSWALLFPSFWYAGKPINLGFMPILSAIWRYIAASVLAAGGCVAVLRLLPFITESPGALGAVLRTVANSVVFGVLYLGFVVVLHGGAAPLRQLGGLLREVLPWSRSGQPAPAEVPAAASVALAPAEEPVVGR